MLKSKYRIDIDDHENANRFIRLNNYYQISGYAKQLSACRESERIPFRDLECLVDLDSRLRLIIYEACSIVEISLRGVLSAEIALHFGEEGYLYESSYMLREKDSVSRLIKDIETAVSKSSEDQSIKERHRGGSLPIWAFVESISFGLLSKMLGGVCGSANTSPKSKEIKHSIKSIYGIDASLMCSVVYHLSSIRNVAAHHKRMWIEKPRAVLPQINYFKDRSETYRYKNSFNFSREVGASANGIYNTLVVLCFLTSVIREERGWSVDMARLLAEFDPSFWPSMSVPTNWKSRPLWADIPT